MFVIVYKTNQTRCNSNDSKCFDGNGKYQYKGRGHKSESVETLLSRIDWLAKNSVNDALYTTSYLIAFCITLVTFFIIYATCFIILPALSIILILFASFIVCFSIMNLFDFHTHRFRNYYIRKNVDYIYKKIGKHRHSAPNPSTKSHMPFRTKVQDVLTR